MDMKQERVQHLKGGILCLFRHQFAERAAWAGVCTCAVVEQDNRLIERGAPVEIAKPLRLSADKFLGLKVPCHR